MQEDVADELNEYMNVWKYMINDDTVNQHVNGNRARYIKYIVCSATIPVEDRINLVKKCYRGLMLEKLTNKGDGDLKSNLGAVIKSNFSGALEVSSQEYKSWFTNLNVYLNKIITSDTFDEYEDNSIILIRASYRDGIGLGIECSYTGNTGFIPKDDIKNLLLETNKVSRIQEYAAKEIKKWYNVSCTDIVDKLSI